MKKLLIFITIFLVLMVFIALCVYYEGINIFERHEGRGFLLFISTLLSSFTAAFFSHGPGFDI